MIRCAACGHENDDTRVFCQSCGARLEAREADAPAPETQRRFHKVPQAPSGGQAARRAGGCTLLLRDAVWTVALAAILACLVQALRAPDDVPPALPPRPALASLLAADIQSAIASVYPRTVEVSPEAANNFLASRVEGVAGQSPVPRARLARVYTKFLNGRAVFGAEQRLGGHPVYLQLVIRPASEGNGMTAVIESGSMGRLPVPPFLLGLYQNSFRPVFEALDAPIGWLAKAGSISISPESAVISWRGSRD